LNLLYVFIGGGLGAMTRYGISKWLPLSIGEFPKATLIANILSCILLGYLMSLAVSKQLEPRLQLLLITGFCGGFSTFSTFSAETFLLLEAGHTSLALSYIGLSIITCLLGIWIGMLLAG